MEQQNNEIKYIPFLNNQEEIKKMLFKIMKKNRLIFNRYKKIDITPMYFPNNFYSYDVCGFIDLNCKKISNWKSQNYLYTKSDIYKVNREVSGKVDNIMVCCSKELDIDSLINSYDYKKLKNINIKKPLEYSILKGDKTKAKIKKEGIDKAKEILKKQVINSILGYDKIEEDKSSILLNNESVIHILLPVWIVELDDGESKQKFYINGQNNKIIYEFKPSGYRLFILWIIIFILTLITMFILKFLR